MPFSTNRRTASARDNPCFLRHLSNNFKKLVVTLMCKMLSWIRPRGRFLCFVLDISNRYGYRFRVNTRVCLVTLTGGLERTAAVLRALPSPFAHGEEGLHRERNSYVSRSHG